MDVPLHTMTLYDEMSYQSNSNTSDKEKKKSSNKSSSITSSVSNLSIAESLPTPAAVATLVQETIGYVKQTYTITQAILLNTPLNNIQGHKNIKIDSKSFESSEDTTNQNGYIEMRSASRNSKNGFDYASLIKDDKQNGYAESYCDNNKYIKRPSSVHSSSSYKSDNSQSINIELNDNMEYDYFKMKDGTLSLEKVIVNNEQKPTINIKYPTKFANLLADKRENNTESRNFDSNGNTKPQDEIDDGYHTGSRLSLFRNNSPCSTCNTPLPPDYIEFKLSEKCNNKLFHVVHLENNGWVLIHEIADVFTNYYIEQVLLKLMQVFQYDFEIRHLTRQSDPRLFSQLDESKLNVPRDKENKINEDFVLNLISLKDMVSLLIKLDFIDQKMVKEAIHLMKKPQVDTEDILYKRFSNKYLFNVMNVIVQYKAFKRTLTTTK